MPNARCFKTSNRWTCVTCQTTKYRNKQQTAANDAAAAAKRGQEEESGKRGKKAAQQPAPKATAAVGKGAKKRKLDADFSANSPASSNDFGDAKKLKKAASTNGSAKKSVTVKTGKGKRGRKKKTNDETVSQNGQDEASEASEDDEDDEEESGDDNDEEEENNGEENEESGDEENEDSDENEEEDEDEEAEEGGEENEDNEEGSSNGEPTANGKPKGRPKKAASAAKRGRKPTKSKKEAKTTPKASKAKGRPSKNNDSMEHSSSQSASPAAASSKTNMTEREQTLCRTLLNDLTRHEHAWPFLEQVDEKAYPRYYEVIKNPMDLGTIKNKMKNKQYETKEQFAYDCRLIFDNCEYFNVDNSDIGKAGHKLRAFFETKWLKIFD